MATAAIIISSFDLENPEEYLQTTTPSAFAEVASEVGIHKVLPFLQTVCQSKRSWQIRRKGIKLVRQIAVLKGVGLLPHLKKLVEIIERGLTDEQQKVRIITALALAALAEASTPYGIDSFDSILKPLWYGIRHSRGKELEAFLRAIGYIIPLMDDEYASYYSKEVMVVVNNEFPATTDAEMKQIISKLQTIGNTTTTTMEVTNKTSEL